MRRRIPDYFISALIGGVVGAAVVLFVTGQNPASLSLEETAHAQIERLFMPGPGVPAEVPNGKFKTLEVERLIITEQAVLNNAEGNPEVFIRDGSVLAEKVIIGQKLIGQKIQGHAIVGNRMFVSPDNLITTPEDKWRFYAEIGASLDAGGEVVVRNIGGHATVGRPTTEGTVLRMGYNPEQLPQILAIQHSDHSQVPVSFELSDEQKRVLDAIPR